MVPRVENEYTVSIELWQYWMLPDWEEMLFRKVKNLRFALFLLYKFLVG